MKPEELSLQGESNLRELHEKGDNSSQHPLQLLDPRQDFLLDRPLFGQGHPSATSRSVRLKSLPTNSSGTCSRSANAQEKHSPKFRPLAWRPLP